MLNVTFLDKNGQEISKIAPHSGANPIDQVLAEGEQIIGIYGSKNQNTILNSLGFIVWKPQNL
jgi:hypothetical protein